MNEIKKNVEAAKKVTELSKKVDVEKRRNERLRDYVVKDINNDRDTGKSRSDLKYSSKYLEHLEKERQKALNEMK